MSEEEWTLRAQLKDDPHNLDLTRALIAVLLRTGRAPFPDDKRQATSGAATLDALADAAEAADDNVAKFALYWQMIVQHPESMRGWAEFARAFASRFDWKTARIAVEKALAKSSEPDRNTASAILSALATMAEQSQLGDLQWMDWFAKLPQEMRATPAGASLAVYAQSPEAPRIVSDMLRLHGDADVDACLAACMSAFGEGDTEKAYHYLRRALELDLPHALRRVTMTFSSQASDIAKDSLDALAAWLTERSDGAADFTIMPLWPAPEGLTLARNMRQAALHKGLPSPLLVTMPRSGSVSVGNIFSSGFALPTVLYSFFRQRVIGPWLADYLRGGACYVTHLEPYPENIELLAAARARPIVHVRDPRQQMVSIVNHYRRYPIQSGKTMDDDADLEELSWNELRQALRWLEGWVEASERLPVSFTTFEEFVSDRDRFLDRILTLYGGDTAHFSTRAAFTEHVGIDYHRRKGSIDDWRKIYSPRQVEAINAAIPAPFWEKFGWRP